MDAVAVRTTLELLLGLGANVGFWGFIFFGIEALRTPSHWGRAAYALFAGMGMLLGLYCTETFVYMSLV